MMKVTFLKSHPSFGYFAGQTGQIFVPRNKVDELVKQGYIRIAPEKEEEPVIPEAGKAKSKSHK